jgi:hypothetical protein
MRETVICSDRKRTRSFAQSVRLTEPTTGQEPVLPANWKQGAYTLRGNVFTYIGKRVRRNDQLPPNFEPANDLNYKDIGEGHVKT